MICEGSSSWITSAGPRTSTCCPADAEAAFFASAVMFGGPSSEVALSTLTVPSLTVTSAPEGRRYTLKAVPTARTQELPA